MSDKLAYGIEELLELSPVGRTTIYKAIGDGRLRAKKCGRRTIVLARDFHEFLGELPPLNSTAAAPK